MSCIFNSTALAEVSKVAVKPSLFLPAENKNIYEKEYSKLTEAEKWKIRMFGLRLAALDPLLWGVRVSEKTENRRLVAIKPYYLRLTEDPNILTEQIRISFRFRKVSDRAEKSQTHASDALLDIGFSGKYQPGAPLERAHASAAPPG